jgi:hypothetical protein
MGCRYDCKSEGGRAAQLVWLWLEVTAVTQSGSSNEGGAVQSGNLIARRVVVIQVQIRGP